MDNAWRILNKLVSLASAILILLLVIGAIFTHQVRSNIFELIDALTNQGIVGFLIACSLIYVMRGALRDIYKIFQAKGFNKKYWDSL